MIDKNRHGMPALLAAAGGALLAFTGTAGAQGTVQVAPDPSPYYLGASQGVTYNSNVYRIPSGPGDAYSSTSLLAGFDQPISRQRVFGKASVSLNRYQDETRLNHTSYDLATGLVWETINHLSGSVNATLGQRLSAPAANVSSPPATRNIAQQKGVNAVARWGGVSLFTLEGTLGYSTLDYSAPEYVTSESKRESGSLGLYYRPSPLLRLGVAGRLDRTRTPKALQQPDGSYQPNQIDGRHLDLLADYELSSLINASGRLSYTKQTNSGASDADFSGLTGNINIGYRPTAKLSFNLFAARDAGFDLSQTTLFVIPATSTPVITPIAGLYENNRVTTSFGLGAGYAATAKINVNARLHYARARVVSTLSTTLGTVGSPDVVDRNRGASLGATWAIARPWLLACNVTHEKRDVSGGVAYAYDATSVGCSAQFTWR